MWHRILKDPEVTPFVECPNCNRLIEYSLKQCPACREEISEDYANLSVATTIINTQAISLANTIRSGEPAAVIILFASLVVFLMDLYYKGTLASWLWISPLAVTALYLTTVLAWFVKFGWFILGDEEFLKVKSAMRASGKLWLALLTVQLAALAVLRS